MNSFRLRLNNEIETLQLSLRERAFQILALKLLKVFEPRSIHKVGIHEYYAHGYYHFLSITELYILVKDD